MNSVYIDSAVAASPIYIGPTNASSIIIGNNKCTTIIGQSLNLANPNFGVTIVGNSSGGQLIVNGDTSGPYASDTGQLIITGNAAPKYRLGFMVDTSLNRASIQAGVSGTAIMPISLNPNGGNLGIGKYGPTQSLDVNGNIALSGNIVLQPATNYVAPSSITQLGGYVEVPFTSNLTFTTTSQRFTIATLTIGTPGVYLIHYSFRYNRSSSTTSLLMIESWFQTSTQTGNSTNTQYGNNSISFNPAQTSPDIICHNGSGVVIVTATSTITFYGFANYTGTAPLLEATYSYYSYTRIA